jgi:hypothetical protein
MSVTTYPIVTIGHLEETRSLEFPREASNVDPLDAFFGPLLYTRSTHLDSPTYYEYLSALAEYLNTARASTSRFGQKQITFSVAYPWGGRTITHISVSAFGDALENVMSSYRFSKAFPNVISDQNLRARLKLAEIADRFALLMYSADELLARRHPLIRLISILFFYQSELSLRKCFLLQRRTDDSCNLSRYFRTFSENQKSLLEKMASEDTQFHPFPLQRENGPISRYYDWYYLDDRQPSYTFTKESLQKRLSGSLDLSSEWFNPIA